MLLKSENGDFLSSGMKQNNTYTNNKLNKFYLKPNLKWKWSKKDQKRNSAI